MYRNVKTELVGKDEVFKMLALGEAVSLPILLIGPPGTAKTACAIDYTNAEILPGTGVAGDEGGEHVSDGDAQIDFGLNDKVFVLETDADTRASSVKGKVDLKTLAEEKRYKMIVPIADANTIVINEIDKASGALRHAFLGIMNEKVIFNGHEEVPCNWNVFVGTCNKIPEDEVNSPFWDRFIIKHEVGRIPGELMYEYFKDGGKLRELPLHVPTVSELNAEIKDMFSDPVSAKKVETFMYMVREHCSDRTISYLPKIISAVKLIWRCGIVDGIVKTAEILVSKNFSLEVSRQVVSKHMKQLHNAVKRLAQLGSKQEFVAEIEALRTRLVSYYEDGKVTTEELSTLETLITSTIKQSSFYHGDEDLGLDEKAQENA